MNFLLWWRMYFPIVVIVLTGLIFIGSGLVLAWTLVGYL